MMLDDLDIYRRNHYALKHIAMTSDRVPFPFLSHETIASEARNVIKCMLIHSMTFRNFFNNILMLQLLASELGKHQSCFLLCLIILDVILKSPVIRNFTKRDYDCCDTEKRVYQAGNLYKRRRVPSVRMNLSICEQTANIASASILNSMP
jgi:hypothetical protein